MIARPSRRAALAGSAAALLGLGAAVGAMSLPAIAETGIFVSEPGHPDAELFRLLDAWGPARAAADAAGEKAFAVWEACLAQEPPRPEVLRWRGDDGLNCSFEVEHLPDGRRAVFYGLEQVGKLMSSALPQRHEWEGQPAPRDPREQVGRWVPVPDERRIARRAEVIDAHHRWMAQCRAVRERLGLDEADEAENDACEALHAVEAAILATAPLTMAGLAAKARWASWDGLPKETAAIRARQVTADVLALAERGGATS